MPANSLTSALPREELALAVVEGENAVDGLIGRKILGDLPINWRTAHIVKATIADTQGMRDISATKYVHAPGTRFERITATFGDATVTVTPRGVEIVVPRETVLDYKTRFDVLSFFSQRFGTQTSALTKEKLIAGAVFNTTNLGSATNSAVAYTRANGATNSFFADVIAATRRRKAAGEVVDTVIIPGPIYEILRQSSLVLSYVRGIYGSGLLEVTEDVLRDALASFGIKNVLIGDAYVNTGADGVKSLTQVWVNDYIAVVKAGMNPTASDTPGVGVPTISGIGAMVYWDGYADGLPSADKDAGSFAGGNYVETYESLEIDAWVIRLKMSHKPYILNANAGELIGTQNSTAA